MSSSRYGWAAAVWTFAYAAAALTWALGGEGFPFGESDPEAAAMGSLFVGASAGAMAGPLAAVFALAGLVAASIARGGRALPRALVLTVGWGMAALLVLLIPDVRLLRDFAYLIASGVGFAEKIDWATVNQLICLAGGIVWWLATLSYQGRTSSSPSLHAQRDRTREFWLRRGRWLTLAAVLLPLPYELTRWAWALGWPVGISGGAGLIEAAPADERIGMFVIASLPLAGGLLTHALTRPWGEVFPAWLPRLHGRLVPAGLVVVPATLAAILIVTGATSLMRISLNEWLGRVPAATPDVTGWGAWLPGLFWLPWGLALGGATYAYWRRRRIDRI